MKIGNCVSVLLFLLSITAICFVISNQRRPETEVQAHSEIRERGKPIANEPRSSPLIPEKDWRDISDEEWKIVREPLLQMGFTVNDKFPYRIDCSTMTWATARSAFNLKAEEAREYDGHVPANEAAYLWYKTGLFYTIVVGPRWTNFVKPSTNWIHYSWDIRIPTEDTPVEVRIMHSNRQQHK